MLVCVIFAIGATAQLPLAGKCALMLHLMLLPSVSQIAAWQDVKWMTYTQYSELYTKHAAKLLLSLQRVCFIGCSVGPRHVCATVDVCAGEPDAQHEQSRCRW